MESHIMSGAMSVTPTMSIQNSIHASVTLLTQVQAVEYIVNLLSVIRKLECVKMNYSCLCFG